MFKPGDRVQWKQHLSFWTIDHPPRTLVGTVQDYNNLNPPVLEPRSRIPEVYDVLDRGVMIIVKPDEQIPSGLKPFIPLYPENCTLYTPPVTPRNNDGRTTCFWCNSPTRKAGMGVYDVCTKCGK